MEIKNSNQRPASIENDHGIILYYHQQSYYSQKVGRNSKSFSKCSSSRRQVYQLFLFAYGII